MKWKIHGQENVREKQMKAYKHGTLMLDISKVSAKD